MGMFLYSLFWGLATLVVSMICAYGGGEEQGRRGTFSKLVFFSLVASLVFACVSAFFFIGAGATLKIPNGKPLADKDLMLNQHYEIMADAGSASITEKCPKRVLLKKEGEQDILYFVLSMHLPENSKHFVPKRYEGESELMLIPCEKPNEKE